MENLINRLVIRNFKSIQHIDLACKRVNVFIGAPNVGKSNILEAVALLGAGYSRKNPFLSDLLRYQEPNDMFFDQDSERYIFIETDLGGAYMRRKDNEFYLTVLPDAIFINDSDLAQEDIERTILAKLVSNNPTKFNWLSENIANNLQNISQQHFKIGEMNTIHQIFSLNTSNQLFHQYKSIVKKYDFSHKREQNYENYSFLTPPFGSNIFSTIRQNKELHKECVNFFALQDLNLVYKHQEKNFAVQKNTDGIVTEHPYSNMADTLQRIIFYLTAIESNKNAVLLFEEPEAHAFPPYTRQLGERIALDDENQYFLTTHSPYLFNTLLSELDNDELNLVLVYYESHETKVKVFSPEEIRYALSLQDDIFFNLKKFIPDYVQA